MYAYISLESLILLMYLRHRTFRNSWIIVFKSADYFNCARLILRPYDSQASLHVAINKHINSRHSCCLIPFSHEGPISREYYVHSSSPQLARVAYKISVVRVLNLSIFGPWLSVTLFRTTHCKFFKRIVVLKMCLRPTLYKNGNVTKPLKVNGYFYEPPAVTFILRSAHTVHLCVVYGSHNKQRLFPCTRLTNLFL
jgi:hypothetical protein